MKYLILLLGLYTFCFASLDKIDSFEADFVQNITDDKNKVLTYKGHILASKPQLALWSYSDPVKKDVYINNRTVTIVEPEIEQVIIKKIESNFDFFKLVQNAKLIQKNNYIAEYKGTIFKIITKNNTIKSILYLDEFENSVEIIFSKQIENKLINIELFQANYPLEFDIIFD